MAAWAALVEQLRFKSGISRQNNTCGAEASRALWFCPGKTGNLTPQSGNSAWSGRMCQIRFPGNSLFKDFSGPNHSASVAFRTDGFMVRSHADEAGQRVAPASLSSCLWTGFFQNGVLRFTGLRNAKTSAYALPRLEHLFGPHNLFEIWFKFNL